jgi:hypothetical protein
MRRFALLLGFALSLIATSAVAQNCDGFVDVLASNPFCPDVTWLKAYGVTMGCDATHFCPNDYVSRLEMAAFMHRLGKDPAFVNGGNAFGGSAAIGTTDNNALFFIVDGQLAMAVLPAVDPTFGFNPNVVNGASSVASGIAGATIAGGGGCNPGTGGTCTSFSFNRVSGGFGTVGGGASNSAVQFATVAGGDANTASGENSTVAGGVGNTASGFASTVAGGALNAASANYSFAAGNRAQASTTGSFIWADSQPFNFGPSVANFFGVRATGGVGLTIAIDPTTGAVTQFCNLLPPIPSWSCTSDRDAKENFIPADGKDILQRLVAMPLFSWNFKGADPTIRSLGPTAQDFYAAFSLGRNDKSIANVNLEGVALAAIQGLNAKLEEQAATIGEQRRELAELKERVQRAETLAADVVVLKAALAELQRGRETVAIK